MTQKNPLITGTLILTGTGFLTRILGFFNRIYLSQIIGAKEMGIYQLIFPVYMVSFALCCHGTELSLSQMVAEFYAKEKKVNIRPLLFVSCLIFTSLGVLLSLSIFHYSDFISLYLLKEESASLCLKIMAPILPFTALRCCLHGYYIGVKKTAVPALGQLLEQGIRIGAIWLCVHFLSLTEPSQFSGASLAVFGMVAGEVVSTFFTLFCYEIQTKELRFPLFYERMSKGKLACDLLRRTIPLTGNKLSLTLISALEAVLIPHMLSFYYKDTNLALSMYGVLTGMSLPFVLFPSTITNSLSVLLLPTISEAKAKNHTIAIQHTIQKTLKLCLTLGFLALIFFFFFGQRLGTYVFHNESAGDFLLILSFLCPFLYLSASGTSILNGLGYLKETFIYNLLALLVRILFILLTVPVLGVQGYLVGLLFAYGVQVSLQMWKIYRVCFR